ncbi:hypothetical protein C1646_809754 [Rhizophagus diaphanus]|nr:hypothetical protein C1646_809754 [Rhizophagus diaphanus] [Rhizophagus sp. MUCL 43196]
MQQKIPTVIIIGAGLGGLTLYHALIKNKDKKEFNVKIFERESGPQENVPVQWGKKCIRYEETDDGVWVLFEDGSKEFCDILVGADGINSPVRKQKLPELQIFDYGSTMVIAYVDAPKNLLDRLIAKFNGKGIIQSVGLNGETTVTLFRLIPIEKENYKNKNESYYRTTIFFEYPSKLDDVEHDKIKVDDNDPASVVDHVKYMIRKLRPECELTNVILELWDLVPKTTSDPSKTYNPIQRRKMQDIDPLSVNTWTSNRITLLGDAAHAMSPVLGLGANNAIEDAEVLSRALLNYSSENYISCIKEYENDMLKRSSADVLKSRYVEIRNTTPVGYIGCFFRNNMLRITNAIMNFFDYNLLARKN